MENKKRIVFVVPSMKSGGAERVIATLANNLISDFLVEIWIMMDSQIEYTISNEIQINKEYATIKKGGYCRLEWLTKHLKKKKNTVVISFMTKMNLYVILAAKIAGVKVIVSERNDPSKTIAQKFFHIRNLIYSLADAIVFQTTGAMDFFPESVRKKGSIILNPLRRNIPNLYTGLRKKKIVTISRLHPQKNLTLLIDAFEEFINEFSEYQLCIFGEGPLENELKEIVKRKKMEDCVTFAGFDEGVLNRICDASMFIITSNFEGLSNSLIEAMAIGLPCISTDSPPGGAKMIIQNDYNGLLVPVGDKREIVKAMKRIASDSGYAEYLGKNATEIRKRVNEDIICNEWKKIISSLIA